MSSPTNRSGNNDWKLPRIQFVRDRSYSQQLTDAVNAYWKFTVAANDNGPVDAVKFLYGVPRREAWPAQYKHPDIVWMRRRGNKWEIVG